LLPEHVEGKKKPSNPPKKRGKKKREGRAWASSAAVDRCRKTHRRP